MNSTIAICLIFLPMAAAPLIYFFGRWRVISGEQVTAVRWIAFVTLLVSWVPFTLTAQAVTASGPITLQIGAISLQIDGLSLLLTAIVLVLGTLVTLYSGTDMAGESGEEKYYATLLIMISMMIGLGCARDLFNLWLWFEGMAISSYLLVAFYHEQPASLEAGVKYLVQSATGSVIVLIGIALVFGQTGQLDLVEIKTAASSPTLWVAGALFTIGFGVKIALVPLHTWLPDAHSQAPSGISAMLSAVVIEAGLVALLRGLTAVAGITPSWGILLMVFGALNMLVGNLLALRQKQVKRLLAYSSLSHVGYMLLGLGIGIYAGEVAGAQGGLFHLFNHGLMKGLAFLAAGALLYAFTSVSGEHTPLMTADLAGAARRYPIVALTLSLAVLGLSGLPPLAGFMSEWQIFLAGFAIHNLLISGLVIFAALNTVLSLAYYAPLVNTVYRLEPSAAVLEGRSLPITMRFPLVLLALAVTVIGIWPGMLQWLTQPAGSALVAAFGS